MKKYTEFKFKDARRYINLLRRWDHVCIICGRSFANLACVTREHLVPKSMGGKDDWNNVAPSHWNCNKHRGTLSLLDAQHMIELKLKRMGPRSAEEWLSTIVPGRDVPTWAFLPIEDAGWFAIT